MKVEIRRKRKSSCRGLEDLWVSGPMQDLSGQRAIVDWQGRAGTEWLQKYTK